jgi:hypothetical protein
MRHAPCILSVRSDGALLAAHDAASIGPETQELMQKHAERITNAARWCMTANIACEDQGIVSLFQAKCLRAICSLSKYRMPSCSLVRERERESSSD